jgi:hypothetical protein
MNYRSRRMKWTGLVIHMGEKGKSYMFLVGKLERNTPLGSSTYK